MPKVEGGFILDDSELDPYGVEKDKENNNDIELEDTEIEKSIG